MINKIIKQEKEKIIADMCRKIADREWIKKLIWETPMTIKALNREELTKKLEEPASDKVKDKIREDLAMLKRHEQDLIDLKNDERGLESDVNSYKVLSEAEEEITNLLK